MDERARARGRELDETWESRGYTWRLRTWQEKRAEGRLGRGTWDATLTAYGAGSVWKFAWSNDGWLTASGAGSVWSRAWPED